MLPIIGWVMLWSRPSWGFLLFFGLCVGLLTLVLSVFLLGGVGVFQRVPVQDIAVALGGDFVWNVGVFIGVGAVIVMVRGGKIEKRAPTDQEIDAELARMRKSNGVSDPELRSANSPIPQQPPVAGATTTAFWHRLSGMFAMTRRNALRWIFIGLAVVLFSWWAADDSHLSNILFNLGAPYFLTDATSFLTENGIGLLVGAGIALYGVYRLVTLPQQST